MAAFRYIALTTLCALIICAAGAVQLLGCPGHGPAGTVRVSVGH